MPPAGALPSSLAQFQKGFDRMYENTKRFTGLASAAVLAATLLAVAGCAGSTNTSSPAGATPGVSATAQATPTAAEPTSVPTPAGPVVSGGVVYVGALDGKLYAIKAG